jgi:hypothetical protein
MHAVGVVVVSVEVVVVAVGVAVVSVGVAFCDVSVGDVVFGVVCQCRGRRR